MDDDGGSGSGVGQRWMTTTTTTSVAAVDVHGGAPPPPPLSLVTAALVSLSLPALSVAFVLPLLASSRSNTRIEYTVTTVTTLTSRCGKMWGRSTLPLTTPTTTTTAHHRSCPSPPSGGKGKVHARQTTQVIRPARIGQLLEDVRA